VLRSLTAHRRKRQALHLEPLAVPLASLAHPGGTWRPAVPAWLCPCTSQFKEYLDRAEHVKGILEGRWCHGEEDNGSGEEEEAEDEHGSGGSDDSRGGSQDGSGSDTCGGSDSGDSSDGGDVKSTPGSSSDEQVQSVCQAGRLSLAARCS
jgi:hypothetical protein